MVNSESEHMVKREVDEVSDDGGEQKPRRAVVVKRGPMYSDDDITKRNVKGKVLWFNLVKGYGFIEEDDTEDNVFVHYSCIVKPNPDHITATLAEEERVSFDIAGAEKGLLAANVKAEDGGHVQGHEKAPTKDSETLPLFLARTVPASKQPHRHYGYIENEDGEWVNKWQTKDILKKAMKGKVMWYAALKGYGRILGDDEVEYFVHHSSVLKPNDEQIVESLGRDEEVVFDVIEAVKNEDEDSKPEAVNVTGPNGVPVLGHPMVPFVCSKKHVPVPIIHQLGIKWRQFRRNAERSEGEDGKPSKGAPRRMRRRPRKNTLKRENESGDDEHAPKDGDQEDGEKKKNKPRRHRRRRPTEKTEDGGVEEKHTDRAAAKA